MIILYYWPRILHALSAVSVMWLYCIIDRVSYTPSVQSQSCDYTIVLTVYPTRCQCSLSHVIILYYWPCILHAVSAVSVMWLYYNFYYWPCIVHAVSAVSVMWLYYITDRVSYTLSWPSESFADTVLQTAYRTRCQCRLSHLTIVLITDRVSYTLLDL